MHNNRAPIALQSTHSVSVYYLPTLINGDCSGIDGDELSLLEDFERDELKGGFIVCPEDIDHYKRWGTCEVSGLMSNVVNIEVWK